MSNAVHTVGIVGLGLIGGSFARAYAKAGWRVLACDTNEAVMDAAMVDTVAAPLVYGNLSECNIIVLAVYPAGSLAWLERNVNGIGDAIVIDTAGIKRGVCERAFELANRHGFVFCGAHPMAGTENSGYAYARADLFNGAPMVLVPPTLPDAARLELLDRINELLRPLGFSRFSVTTADRHDRITAFTSQLPHVVSNAFVKSPTAQVHTGFSAGSYRDLTRVAHLNAPMWSELMMENGDYLVEELDTIIASLSAYRNALADGDRTALEQLLAEGDRIKRELDDGQGR